MAETRSFRTNSGYVLAVLVLLGAGLVWATQTHRAATTSSATTSSQPVTTVTQPASGKPAVWTGELLLVRHDQLIARQANGVERIVYAAPTGTTLGHTSQVAAGVVFVELRTGQASQVLSVKLVDGSASLSSAPDLTSSVPRPTGGSFATIVSSNAERDFGFTVNVVHGQTTTKLYQSPTPISAMSWRNDGEVLAIANQASLVLVTLTAGDTQTIPLPAPVVSLSWFGADVVMMTAQGPLLVRAGSKTATTLALDHSVGHDLLAVDDHRYLWISGASGSADILEQTVGQTSHTIGSTASALLGFRD